MFLRPALRYLSHSSVSRTGNGLKQMQSEYVPLQHLSHNGSSNHERKKQVKFDGATTTKCKEAKPTTSDSTHSSSSEDLVAAMLVLIENRFRDLMDMSITMKTIEGSDLNALGIYVMSKIGGGKLDQWYRLRFYMGAEDGTILPALYFNASLMFFGTFEEAFGDLDTGSRRAGVHNRAASNTTSSTSSTQASGGVPLPVPSPLFEECAMALQKYWLPESAIHELPTAQALLWPHLVNGGFKCHPAADQEFDVAFLIFLLAVDEHVNVSLYWPTTRLWLMVAAYRADKGRELTEVQ